ncbi:hypothetical protein HX13_06775 [Chryseobacterium sp. P1-3]|uniref:Uncharacterized protein n=1 Tax=Chryseobacterium gallinarum TaxID=1324352 RepID=A0A0G3M9J0_CHRGL|nr:MULTISPECIES: hypothetical protein [Chryseobacterium]AKK74613.1 hypothetical protein OK18_20150 [Chryseobacterium gallinarum]KFF75753.1 hypothetical protein HX13_06775 [Chryseobacterium sp. P1-3]MCL8538452.1 hypothetical protein [Chryseobacterium gallinarum]QIY89585.1 hypothetical protein FOB44_02470 [Chryseobacterium gallinarum]
MIPEDNINQQNRRLEEMDYNPNEDIFKKEKHIPLDGDGNPIWNENEDEDKIDGGLDIPGGEEDDDMEEIGAEDEENNYWSLSDNNDDHEEENDDVLT